MRRLCGFLVPLVMACSVPPLEVGGKGCQADRGCPSGWVCVPSTQGATCQPGIAFQAGLLPSRDYSSTRDAPIREAFPNQPDPSVNEISLDGDEPSGSGLRAWAVLFFDVTAVPADAELLAATMQLTFRNESGGAVHDMYLLLRSWTEDATWLEASPGNPWEAPGAQGASDRGAVVGQWVPSQLGPVEVELNSAGLEAVRGWVREPSTNHGFLIVSVSGNGADFVSREGATPSERPRLLLRY